MRTDHQLRLYANPVRLLIFPLVCGAFTVGSVWILGSSSDIPGEIVAEIIGWGFLGISGCWVAVTLPQLVWAGLLRHPILQIDEQGWSCWSWLFLGKRTAAWQDIASIGLRRERLGAYPSRRPTSYSYFLVVHAKDPAVTARVGHDPVPIRSYRRFGGARIVVDLDDLFVQRIPPEKVEGVLRQILNTYAFEVALYGIQASTEIQDV